MRSLAAFAILFIQRVDPKHLGSPPLFRQENPDVRTLAGDELLFCKQLHIQFASAGTDRVLDTITSKTYGKGIVVTTSSHVLSLKFRSLEELMAGLTHAYSEWKLMAGRSNGRMQFAGRQRGVESRNMGRYWNRNAVWQALAHIIPDQPKNHVILQSKNLYMWMTINNIAETHVHWLSKNKNARKVSKGELLGMLEECLHLRLDVILRSMPAGTGTIIDAQTNWLEYCWVIGRPREDAAGNVPQLANITKQFINRREAQFELGADPEDYKTPKGVPHPLAKIQYTKEGHLKKSGALTRWRQYKASQAQDISQT
ncbi:hypothetical protein G7Y89_g6316 [Cudoniella acicularis]|uniref:Uncharacterized protein n=1 Tax=Cudoniella acicularis TaxID=354080 RepID=A0A8H4RN57_9HELO|nr:hypothetical protein G7Y89_g6316 [Cudoniella acicularis]